MYAVLALAPETAVASVIVTVPLVAKPVSDPLKSAALSFERLPAAICAPEGVSGHEAEGCAI
ncbi:hypothetical protein RZS08_24145, partial [Arthrospira platensis SPKY1]|nr:hypothetical protein [Arthrospira platensis SPKY1]